MTRPTVKLRCAPLPRPLGCLAVHHWFVIEDGRAVPGIRWEVWQQRDAGGGRWGAGILVAPGAFQITCPLAGLRFCRTAGFELHLLGLSAGLRLRPLAPKTPFGVLSPRRKRSVLEQHPPVEHGSILHPPSWT